MSFGSILRRRSLWLTLLAALLFGVLAYQFRPTYNIPVGSWYDRVAIRDGWWGDELADGQRYRWTSGHASIELANFGTLVSGDYDIGLEAQFYNNKITTNPPLTITVGSKAFYPRTIDPRRSVYSFLISNADLRAAGNPPRITIEVPTFTVPGDSRNLGVKVTGISVQESGTDDFSFVIPPLTPLVYLVLIALFAYLTLIRQRIIGAASALIGLVAVLYSLPFNLPISVWLLPATLVLAIALLLIAWRRELFGWYPPLLARLRSLPEGDGQRIRFNGEAEKTDDPGADGAAKSLSPAGRGLVRGESRRASDAEASDDAKSLSQRERFGEGESRPAPLSGKTDTANGLFNGQTETTDVGAQFVAPPPPASDQGVMNHAPTEEANNDVGTQFIAPAQKSHSSFTINHSPFTIILLVAIAVYAIFALWLVAQVDFIGHADYADNAVVARNIVHGLGATSDYVAQFYTQYPSVQHAADTWPLLQPLITVPFLLVSDTTFAAKLPNLILMLMLAASVFYVGRRIWGARVALLAAILVLVHPAFLGTVVYPVNDLSFTLLFLWLIYIVVTRRLSDAASWRAWAAFGLLAGLLIWSKPSGAALLAALFGYALFIARGRERAGTVRRIAISSAIAIAVALVVISPLLIRNLTAFHSPFYSTESYDAWVLKWNPPFERIYAYWSPNDLPNRSWLLRYGYDAIYRGIGREAQALWAGNSPTGGGSGLFGGDIGRPLAVTLAILALFVAPRGWQTPLSPPGERVGVRRRGQGEPPPAPTDEGGSYVEQQGEQRFAPTNPVTFPLLLSLILYAAFVVIYWHYEPRYFYAYVPWVYLLAAAALFWLYDAIPKLLPHDRARIGLIGATLLVIIYAGFLLYTSVSQIYGDAINYAGATPLVESAQWFEANTAPGTVVMSRNPWEFSWHSNRLGVMIPNDPQDINRSLPQIKAAAQEYNASYLMLDHLGPPGATYFRPDWRRDIAPMYNQRTACTGFSLVYQNKSMVIYKMDPNTVGTTCHP